MSCTTSQKIVQGQTWNDFRGAGTPTWLLVMTPQNHFTQIADMILGWGSVYWNYDVVQLRSIKCTPPGDGWVKHLTCWERCQWKLNDFSGVMSLCSKPQNDFGDSSTSAGPSNSYLQYSSMKWFWRGSSLPVKWFWKLWTYPCEMIFGGLKVNDFEGLEVPKWNMRPKWFWNIRGLYFEWNKKEMILRNDFLIPTPPPKSFPKVGVINFM